MELRGNSSVPPPSLVLYVAIMCLNSTGISCFGFGLESVRRTVRQVGAAYQLREPSVFYNDLFGGKNDDIGVENGYVWDVYL